MIANEWIWHTLFGNPYWIYPSPGKHFYVPGFEIIKYWIAKF